MGLFGNKQVKKEKKEQQTFNYLNSGKHVFLSHPHSIYKIYHFMINPWSRVK